VSIGAWCLMDNHFHFILKEETDGGISKFMQKLSTGYTMYFNIKYQRTGSLFGSRFKSKHIDNDNYLRHLFAYVHLNPLDINFSGWKEEIKTNQYTKEKSKEWRDFLENYKYSSFYEYSKLDSENNKQQRPEFSILTPKAFPCYFSENLSFDDFINDYIEFDSDKVQPS
jgi:putative transposase